MTITDPQDRAPDIDSRRNRYFHRSFKDNSRWVLVAIVVVLLASGVVAYNVGGHYRIATNGEPDSTTGQRTNPPIAAPRMIPLPPMTPDPITMTGQGARPEVAPPVPKEPRIDD